MNPFCCAVFEKERNNINAVFILFSDYLEMHVIILYMTFLAITIILYSFPLTESCNVFFLCHEFAGTVVVFIIFILCF